MLYLHVLYVDAIRRSGSVVLTQIRTKNEGEGYGAQTGTLGRLVHGVTTADELDQIIDHMDVSCTESSIIDLHLTRDQVTPIPLYKCIQMPPFEYTRRYEDTGEC